MSLCYLPSFKCLRVLFFVGTFSVFHSYAQVDLSEEQLKQARASANSQKVDISQYMQSGGKSTRSANGLGSIDYGPIPQGEETLPPPFGANLFQGGFSTQRHDGLNAAYLVSPGDKIAIQMWGTVNREQIATVDNQGNIFIPDVGPVAVKDVPASRINSVVTQNIKSVYTNNVSIYVNLLTATPVGVYVTGAVGRPGQYAGLASDSILSFLKQAGGIDPYRGSYRKIKVIRQGEDKIHYDLYEFLKKGQLTAFSFQDQDVVLVEDLGPVVTVEGAARFPFRFELNNKAASGDYLMSYARPLSSVSHVAVTGERFSGPMSVYLPKEEFKAFSIADGDTVLFNEDLKSDVISVQLSGSYEGPSFYAVDKDAKLLDLLSYVEVDPEQSHYQAIYIKRQSVIEQQKALIEESLQRLERSIFTAPASSSGEAAIRAQEAQLVSQFVARARLIEPLGKVIVADEGDVANIRLEQGDEIVIPPRTDLIQISGEVLLPQAVVYSKSAKVSDYIAWAGGFSDRANDDSILVVHANGLTTFTDVDDDFRLAEGDQVLVLPKVDTKILQAVKDITQVIYQIAIAANVALN